MSKRSKKRRSTVLEEKQKTLTQIGFFYQTLEDKELNYDDDVNEDSEETSRVRKRRKIVQEPAVSVTRQTRSSVRHAAKRILKGQDDEENLKLQLDENRIPLEESFRAIMPPPKTPQSTRRKEVPSSQSPANTPLSRRCRKSQRDLSRSPLKEKTTNNRRVRIRDLSARKSVCWTQTREVADSSEQEDEGSLPSILAPETTSSIPIKYEMTNDGTRTSGDGPTLPTSGVEVLACPQQQSFDRDVEDASASKTQNMKSEVSDSEADEQDDGFSEEIDTLAALENMDAQLDNSYTKQESILTPNTWTTGRVPNGSDTATSSKQRGWHSEHSSAHVDLTQASHPQLCNNAITRQRPKQAKNPSSSTSSVPRSESEEVSFQLAHDLHSHTQTCMVPETEFEFEKTLREYNPAPLSSNEDRDPSKPDEFRLPNHTPRALNSEVPGRNLPLEEPQLPILPHPSSTAAILPSQTTTDDTTQPSLVPIFSQKLRFSSPLPALPAFAFPDSPQSEVTTTDEYAGEWDGVPLTESQLLPDSLMNGTLIEPPSSLGDESEMEWGV
ncbi:hypothetical protein MMC29_004091 [Sticta canariensis]|nr:hypothetical protein [Sticta canariensis]